MGQVAPERERERERETAKERNREGELTLTVDAVDRRTSLWLARDRQRDSRGDSEADMSYESPARQSATVSAYRLRHASGVV